MTTEISRYNAHLIITATSKTVTKRLALIIALTKLLRELSSHTNHVIHPSQIIIDIGGLRGCEDCLSELAQFCHCLQSLELGLVQMHC